MSAGLNRQHKNTWGGLLRPLVMFSAFRMLRWAANFTQRSQTAPVCVLVAKNYHKGILGNNFDVIKETSAISDTCYWIMYVKNASFYCRFKQGKMYRYEPERFDIPSLVSFVETWHKNVKAVRVPGEATAL